jgi:hypothetical protein
MQEETRKHCHNYLSRATSFNPKNFTEETPTKVVSEYLKSIEADLVKTFQKYQLKSSLSMKELIEQENVNSNFL